MKGLGTGTFAESVQELVWNIQLKGEYEYGLLKVPGVNVVALRRGNLIVVVDPDEITRAKALIPKTLNGCDLILVEGDWLTSLAAPPTPTPTPTPTGGCRWRGDVGAVYSRKLNVLFAPNTRQEEIWNDELRSMYRSRLLGIAGVDTIVAARGLITVFIDEEEFERAKNLIPDILDGCEVELIEGELADHEEGVPITGRRARAHAEAYRA